MQSRMLLHMAQLLKPSITVGAFVRLLSSVYPDVLNELMVGAKGLQALLALVGFYLPTETSLEFPCVHLHSVFVHKYL